MKKLLDFLKNHLADAVTIAGTIGFGTVLALLEDARRMLDEHTTSSVLLAAAAFLLGATASRLVFETSAWAKRRKKIERLERTFLCLPKRSKELVARALDEGGVDLFSLDQDALVLCEVGVFGTPPVSTLSNTRFSVQPSVVREISEHRSEWLGM